MKITCPSKTFLIGEYAVLKGGAALLLTTPPYFRLENGVFIDPWQGAGGFGASGAKFVLAAKQSGYSDPWAVWAAYKQADLHGSGADIVAQWVGGVTFFYPEKKMIEKLSWPFPELLITLIHTGHKILTHEHLQNSIDFSEAELTAIVLKAYQAIKQADQPLFLKAINTYAEMLYKSQLVCDNTLSLLAKMKTRPEVLALKGCGALGADVILAIIQEKYKTNFLSWAHQEKLNTVFCDNQFAEGVSLS